MRTIVNEVKGYKKQKEQTRESQNIYNGWEKGELTSEKAHETYQRKPYDISSSKIKVRRRLNNDTV